MVWTEFIPYPRSIAWRQVKERQPGETGSDGERSSARTGSIAAVEAETTVHCIVLKVRAIGASRTLKTAQRKDENERNSIAYLRSNLMFVYKGIRGRTAWS